MNIFQEYLAQEFAEDYQEGRITRRQALKLILSVTGSALIADTFLAACTPVQETSVAPSATTGVSAPTDTPVPQPSATEAAAMPEATATGAPTMTVPAPAGGLPAHGTVVPDDPAVQAGEVEFPGSDGAAVKGYLSQPAGAGPFAVVLVCHENRGLTAHIQDVTRRLAKAGYVALAVDLLSRSGGSAALGSDAVPGILGNTPPEQFVADFRSGWEYLKANPAADVERVGMTGFCFGGGVTWQVATKMAELRAAMPFYGPAPEAADIPGIQAPVLAIYGGSDSRINGGIPAVEAAMQANNKVYEKVIYDGADHAFFNDTGSRYNAEAAADAWKRMLDWFGKYLG
jgi:carboxymethylenebutenolidase